MRERRRFESELADLEVIGGHDGRTRVPTDNTLAVPFRWVCWLRVPDTNPGQRSFGAGTGVLVGPRHVLTAAHVLVSEDDPGKTVGDRLRVEIARNGRDAPWEPVKVRGWQVEPRWIVKHAGRWHARPRFDYALVTLSQDVSAWKNGRLAGCALSYWGAPGRCGHGSSVGFAAADVNGQEAQVTGYPGTKPKGTLWTASGPIRFDRDRGVVSYAVDTTHGQSGGPVWIEGPRLVAIHSRPGVLAVGNRSGYLDNVAALITPEVVRQIEDWKRTYVR